MRHNTKAIVVAIADKQPSALLFALNEARMRSAPLRVVHSAGVPAQAVEFYIGVNASMLDTIKAAGEAVLADARSFVMAHAPSLDVEYVLTDAAPLDALRAEADGARMLVLGADDVPWYERLLRTRISGYLAKHSPCPVVVVPELEFPESPLGEVVVTVAGDMSPSGALRMGFEEADARDCLLRVLFAVPPGTTEADAAAARARFADTLTVWRRSYPDVAVLEAYPTDAGDSSTLGTIAADLVVVSRPRNHVAPLSLTRPVAMTVLRLAQCPVVVVPADYDGA